MAVMMNEQTLNQMPTGVRMVLSETWRDCDYGDEPGGGCLGSLLLRPGRSIVRFQCGFAYF
jgi:hypothetical protein